MGSASGLIIMSTRLDPHFVIVADIGGTHCRFATLGQARGQVQQVQQQQCRQYPDFTTALLEYCNELTGQCAGLCLALPGPVHLEPVPLINNPWASVSLATLRSELKFPVWALNDFSAQAHLLPHLKDSDVRIWRAGPPTTAMPTAATELIIGPGTGLGVAGLINQQTVIESEAGQMALAANSPNQDRLLAILRCEYPRILNETVLSGPGLSRVHAALHDGHLLAVDDYAPATLISNAHAGDQQCQQTINEFASWFGSVCGDLALGMGATGGVTLSGNLLHAMQDVFPVADFLTAFNDKQGYRDFCAMLAVRQVTVAQPGLQGAACFAQQQLAIDADQI